MKVDRSKLKKSSSEVPPNCKQLIDKLKGCNEKELLEILKSIKTWNYGKSELYHWIDVLDLFDSILERCCHKEKENQWTLPCDVPNSPLKELLISIIVFTALLIEHSFSKHVYNSMEHLTTLLASSDMQIVLAVLNLLFVFGKRSNFITRLSADRKKALFTRLNYLAESWGGKENGFGLADCCQDNWVSNFPSSATTLHFEFYTDDSNVTTGSTFSNGTVKKNTLNVIHIDNVDRIKGKTLAQIMEELIETYNVPKDKQMLLFTHLRLARNFSNDRERLQCVHARLQALSIIVYCSAMPVPDCSTSILYNGFIEELVEVLELKELKLLDIKAAALRTLTSVIHLDHNTKLNTVIDVTEASSYHGFLPTLVRSCIQALIDGDTTMFPLPFATSLFSFLYHLASYENGGEALVSCGMIESLLKVISWKGSDPEHITFVTRAVRVIDLITNLDMSAFQAHGGLNVFILRLEYEVDICRKEQPYVIDIVDRTRRESQDLSLGEHSGSTTTGTSDSLNDNPSPMEVDMANEASNSQGSSFCASKDLQCYPQRGAVLKSMMNFLKKAIQDSAFSDSIRHLMDGSLPKSLRHIISNAEYYGPSLFMLATDVVTVYVFQEPSLLSALQESGLTDVVLHALLVKEVPPTREVIASLPNVFSALCLNTRGLETFISYKPFDKIFKLLLSPDYLPAMRRRRSSDPMGDTASNLGSAMDELMRHQPSLRSEATAAIVKLLKDLCSLGLDPNCVCSKPAAKGIETNTGSSDSIRPVITTSATDAGSSDDEEEEDEDTTTAPTAPSLVTNKPTSEQASTSSITPNDVKQPVPLVDYILHVMRFLDAILSNNSTDDHCREFVKQKGLEPLLNILLLPNLPIDFPLTSACITVSGVCKTILNLNNERDVLKIGLNNLNSVLNNLEPLHRPLDPPGGSVLLEELVQAYQKCQGTCTDPLQSSALTPLLHYMSAAHAYIIMFVHVCRTGQSEMRSLSIVQWGSRIGLNVLKGLSRLYTSLVWESTVLLVLCSESAANASWEFGRHQLEKLATLTKESEVAFGSTLFSGGGAGTPSSEETPLITSKMEIDETCENSCETSELSKMKKDLKPPISKSAFQMKQVKPLLSSASRLGRALAELFGLLVKLCVGSPIRHRRSHVIQSAVIPPPMTSRAVACYLTRLLARGLSWIPPPTSPIPKFRLTFYICSVGFTSPMLFDERKYPYHLMLQKFVQCNGQEAFFETFRWALTQGGKVPIEMGLEHPNLPDGAGEFLDSWLMLLEKMVNPKMVLDSPHTMHNINKAPRAYYVRGALPFDPIKYLISTHKKAFGCIMHLWNKRPLKVYGERMSESVLAILCHLLRGETIIKEKLSKEKEKESKESTSSNGSSSAGSRSNRYNELVDTINAEQLQQLTDMGFSRDLALEALMQASSLEQATEYILSHGLSARPSILDWEMSEEDQMIRAISMSLGENVGEETSASGEFGENVGGSPKDEEPLSQELMDDFTRDILPGCLRLLDTLPETVYRVCDLLIAVCGRNGEKWTQEMLNNLLGEINRNVCKLIESSQPMTSSDKRSVTEWALLISQLPEAYKAATRMHLFSLLFEDKRNQCANLLAETNLIDNLVQLLEAAQNAMSLIATSKSTIIPTPKWLAPVILLIDLYEKSAVASTRRAPLLALPRRQWKWFDDRTGKWSLYTAANNKAIDDAYKNGESFVQFMAGRRKYTVQFSTMVQINEESGNWRPIMFVNDDRAMEVTEESSGSSMQSQSLIPSLSPLSSPSRNGNEGAISISSAQIKSGSSLDGKSSHKIVKVLESSQCSALIRACVGFINILVEPETLHAVMRLVLRITRNYEYAALFEELGGVRNILQLTHASAFNGFTSLATLIIRHVIEEPATLRQTMERVVRVTTLNSPSSCKEMHYTLRVLGPAACRNSEIFLDTAKSILRIYLMPLTKREEDDTRLLSSQAVQILKSLPSKASLTPNPSNNIIREVICDLLNALTVKSSGSNSENETQLKDNEVKSCSSISSCVTVTPRIPRESSSSDLISSDDVDEIVAVDDTTNVINNTTTNGTNNDKTSNCSQNDDENMRKPRLLLNQSSIMRLLAELVRSYTVVAKMITDHIFMPGSCNDLIMEECSALSFILDHLLPNISGFGDKDCPALARVLIAAIASCNYCPDAQTVLIYEVRASLHRALALPESNEKHIRVQAILGLICTMIDSCPSCPPVGGNASSQTQQQNSFNSIRNQISAPNNIVKIMLRRGVVNDMARITHSLDFSSPHMALTVNSALKPLETLSKMINLPNLASSQSKRAKSEPATSSHVEAMEEDTSTVAANVVESLGSDGPTDVVQCTESSGNVEHELVYELNENEITNQNPSSRIASFDTGEGVVIEDSVHYDIYNDSHSRSSGLIDDVMRSDHQGNEETGDAHENVINSNGAESESGEESESEDDDDDEDPESNPDEEERDEEEEDEDEEDDHVDDDEDDVEDDEIPPYVNHELEDAVVRINDRESEHFILDLEDVIPAHVWQDGSLRLTTLLPAIDNEQLSNTADASQPSIPPAPGNVSISHPLLMRHGDVGSSLGITPSSTSTTASILNPRGHRGGRQRVYRPSVTTDSASNHSIRLVNGNPNPPAILQRLLGTSTAQNFLQLTSASSASQTARVIFSTNDFQIIAEEDWFDVNDSTILSNSSTSPLGSIPSAMLRWTEESRVLDGDSMHDCVASLKPSIIEVWEKHRDEEIAERKDKRKKIIEEEEKLKREFKEKKSESTFVEKRENKSASESNVNASTERLAASLVEQVLGPVIANSSTADGTSSLGTSNAITNSEVSNTTVSENNTLLRTTSMEGIERVSVRGNESPSCTVSDSLQNDNEITEMICSISTAEQERPIAMDVNDDERNVFVESNEIPPAPPERASISEVGAVGGGNVISSEDLSTLTNSSSEGGMTINGSNSGVVGNEEIDQQSNINKVSIENTEVTTSLAPEPDFTVEVVNSDCTNANPPAESSSADTSSANNLSDQQNLFGDTELPEGVDPSFLAALPESIRQEVISEHLRLQRINQQRAAVASGGSSSNNAGSSSGATPSFSEVNPEFLAALPPNIQEEVLAQQHAEQQRLQAQTSSPDAPVDPGSFILTLAPPLRRQVLSDIDDSLLALLPVDLASEAQNIRQDLEARHRQIQERFFASHTTALSRILRTASGRARYALNSVAAQSSNWSLGSRSTNLSAFGPSSTQTRAPYPSRFKGRQLLDHEALTCLLILLFVDEPKLNIGRLHRVLRNLCHHIPTRQWVINSLLSIMERTRDLKEGSELSRTRKGSFAGNSGIKSPSNNQTTSWLSISLDAALGCRTNVFQIHRSTSGSSSKKSGTCNNTYITIHPQAAPLVCRHVLDTLISLAKSFPHHLIPDQGKEEPKASTSSQGTQTDRKDDTKSKDPDFWEVLLRLDSMSSTKKGKNVVKGHGSTPVGINNFSTMNSDGDNSSCESHSPLAQIINLLSHPVVKKSSLLTDKLLRLLSLVALFLHSCESACFSPPNFVSREQLNIFPFNRANRANGNRSTNGSRESSNREGPPTPLGTETNNNEFTNKTKESEVDKMAEHVECTSKAVVSEEHIKLAVEVLTSKSCSEEGLEDATSLLLRLSRSCPIARNTVLKLLLEGARSLGNTVGLHIEKLNEELKRLNLSSRDGDNGEGGNEERNVERSMKGVIHDRFTQGSIVISAATHVKHNSSSKEVQLPSMAALTSKTSSQSFFLRILKVIVQLRVSARMYKMRTRNVTSGANVQSNIDTVREPTLSSSGPSHINQPVSSSLHDSLPSSSPLPLIASSSSLNSDSMEVDTQGDKANDQESLSSKLKLDHLWECLSDCLLELANAPDHHAVLVLQPTVEAFFLVHDSEKEPKRRRDNRTESRENQLAHVNADLVPLSPLPENSSEVGNTGANLSNLPPDTQKFLAFAETHKVVLNQILRQSTTPLANGPFAVLVDHTRVLDFDVKRRYFRQELDRLDNGARREDLAVHVRREHVFEDSFRELYRRSAEEWKNRFYIVFEGEEGQDAGGLLREWYTIISREIFNPMYALFTTSPGDRVTYMINSASHCNSNHLQYFKFVGRVIAKAIYDNKLLECYFTRSFYKHILGKFVKYHDMESEDYSFYQGLVFLLEHDIKELGYELTYSLEVQEFGVTEIRDLKPNGRNILVTEENKHEYVRLVCQEKMTGAIRKQLNSFLEGFYEIIPKRLISIFNEQELELLISGLPNIDIDDLKANCEYHKYQPMSLQIQWFWRALRSFDQADRAKFLQFVTGTSKVPLPGFSALEGMNGTQRFQIHRDDRSTDRLPSAHTCFNQLDLPAYETYDKLRTMLLKAIHECSEGFGFA